jgi:dienelactone hydrolase
MLRLHVFLLAFLAQTAQPQSVLPGTAPLTSQGDLAMQMVDAINADLMEKTAQAPAHRSATPDRERLRKIIGAVDVRLPVEALEYIATTQSTAQVGAGAGYKIFAVRWPVFAGVTGAGLLYQPDATPVARVVVLPDPDSSATIAPLLAANGCQVVVPTLIDRRDEWSGTPYLRMTNQSHREFIYRMAFETGRHIIGYEVQKTLAAVDWFAHENATHRVPIAVAGHGEGGLIAFYSAALDTRIDAALVSGYFSSRQNVWQEPIYRDVWSLLRDFGDAEIAGLIAPRTLIVETSKAPEVTGPPAVTRDRSGAAPNGSIVTPALDAVKSEFERARRFYSTAAGHLQLAADGQGAHSLLRAAGSTRDLKPAGPAAAMPALAHQQFNELVAFTQELVKESPRKREAFWSKADASSPERWRESTKFYRDYIWQEVIGRMPDPSSPPNPRTRLIYDTPKFRGYEVVLDVWGKVFAYGTLLVPKDMKPGERRAVVVCQHGLEGRPADVADPAQDNRTYHAFAARLAEQGYITYAPQNPYIGEDRFRIIQRKAHPLKLSLFSYIIGQHQQTIAWLSSLPFVDARRIGFYGLSYGGKTAVRVPPFLEGYALSICSGDFNEWLWKTTRVDSSYSYMFTREYDMLEFDFASVVNYSDLANLMAPRPFMVERGHMDGVAPDEWVAYEFSKVQRFYDTKMNMPDRARIEFFNGPHTINGKGTFEFLRRHLGAPAGAAEYRHPIVFGRGHTTEKLHSKIWIMEEDGSNLRQLTHGTTYDDHPSLYSDLRHVLYSEFPVNDLKVEAGAKLIRLDIYTGAREVVAEVPGCALHHASIGPIGEVISYHKDCGKNHQQWVGVGKDAYRVTTAASNGVAVPGAIIFMHEINKGPGSRLVSLVEMWGHGPGARMVELTDDEHLHRRPAISPDGKLLAWQTDMNGKDDEIYLANADGSGARNLTSSAGDDGHPWFSRDGKTIVFESNRTGTWEIWKMDLAGRKCTQLTHGGKEYESTRPRM